MKSWPFDQEPNCAVITQRSVLEGKAIIRFVSHNLDDHGWQFLDGSLFDMSQAVVLGLSEIVEHDASVLEIADLPPGWIAERESKDAPWTRKPHP